ncbi:MAG: T9SS type A sorting domain-containing protein [Lentimicrobiaceae bacterium]|nr:T9SS type A sorting domain-containing protein [Lentimicrobiaceae bacterium]
MKKNLFTLIVLVSIIFIHNRIFSQVRGGRTTPDFTNLNDTSVTCYYGTIQQSFQSVGVNITSASGMRVDSLLTNYFVGDGVTISNARFNGQAIVNSNQLGIFTNQETSFPNMPIEEGIVIVTGDFNDAASGNYNNTESSVSVPNSDGNNVSIALSDLLNSNGSSQLMHDVGCISFDFKSHGNIVSFRYSFASEEYLEFVNSVYNDIFAFFISGPYDEDDNLITSDSSYYYQYNIAKIPGTQYPVCINNVNHITYPEYFRLNENDNCKMDGYTVELETEPINIVPNGRYKMELAISDIGDSWNNSAVYLTANSFSFSTDLTDTICQGETYTMNGFSATETGVYTLNFETVNGFDSIVTLNLIVNPSYDFLIIDTICEGYDYMDYNLNIINPSDGVHNKIQNLSTIYGCDSIVRLNLTVNPSYDITITESICEGDDYTENGFIFENKPAGNYFDTLFLNTVLGCDSIVRLNLTVHPTYDITITESICEGESYTENGFIFENKPAGNYFDTLFLNTVLGCDSIVKLQLTINKTYRFDIYDSICEGDDYNMYGLNIINPNVGIYEYMSNLHTTNGCDSIYNIDLKVINKYEDIVIEGIEEISVATNLSTGCYKYTIGEVENHEHYTWEIDNEEWKIIPDNNECIVCATTPDKGTLYVRAENYCGSVYDYIVLNAKFIEDQDNADVRIYPNPITDFVNIQQNDITCINVYDSFGQIVIGNNYNFDNQVTLDLSNLRSSIYIIEIITLEQTFVERIYIKK